MKKRIKQVVSHPLISGSTIIFLGSNFANVLSYLYTIGMGNLLSDSQFGTLLSLIAIINILAIFAQTIQTVFTKFSASFVGQGKTELIGTLFIKGTIWIGIIGFIVCVLLTALSVPIASFLHIENVFFISVVAGTLFFMFVTSVAQGILQGLLKFFANSLINIISSLAKLLFAIGLIYVGYGVFGALFSIFLATVIGYLFAFIPLKKYLRSAKNKKLVIPDLHNQLIKYGLPVLLSSIGITAFISFDIILVKHYFNSDVAGQYAKISVMGRSIFYLIMPISQAAFPLFAQRKERNEKLGNILFLSLVLMLVPAFFASAVYFIFPSFVQLMFFPGQNLPLVRSLIGPFSIFIILFSLSWLLNNFYLSTGKTKVFIISISASILEIMLIIFFHQSLRQVIYVLIGTSLFLCIALAAYFPFASREKLR